MKISIPKGKYVVAVSGGVDSMALLHLLAQQRKQETGSRKQDLDLVVAHFNHGIRADAGKDEELVRQAAKNYGMAFETGHGRLGANASEERAREARYKFLEQIKKKHRAQAIITAHHQDDLLETAFINIIRGTGRRGMTAIADNPGITRPMLSTPKQQILAYAKKNSLRWVEDPSNEDERYLRNYVRRRILPELDSHQRHKLLRNIGDLTALNRKLNLEIAKLSHKITSDKEIDKANFIVLPTEIAREVLISFLRENGITQFDRPAIERLLVAVKTARAGTRQDVTRGAVLEIGASKALLMTTVNR